MATFTNQARITYNGAVADSNVVTGEVLDVLGVTKSALNTTYNPDGTVTYAITLTNTGNTELTGINVSDNLGAYTFNTQTLVPLDYTPDSLRLFVNGNLQPTPAPTSVNPLTLDNITIPAGGNALIIYEARANEFAPLGTGEINNTVSAATPGRAAPVTDSLALAPASGALLDIVKAVSPAVVNENGQLTYTLNINNYGDTAITTADDAVISDTFNPILDPITVTYNGTPWVQGTNYDYDAGTGVFTTRANQLAIPAATYAQNPVTGAWSTTPGSVSLVIEGTVQG